MYVVFQRENWKIEFLDTLVYKDHNNRSQATFNKKQTDHQNYPHTKTAHALSLKMSIAYSQALRIKRVCSTFDEYENHLNELIKRFVEKEYKENIIRNQIKKYTFWRDQLC